MKKVQFKIENLYIKYNIIMECPICFENKKLTKPPCDNDICLECNQHAVQPLCPMCILDIQEWMNTEQSNNEFTPLESNNEFIPLDLNDEFITVNNEFTPIDSNDEFITVDLNNDFNPLDLSIDSSSLYTSLTSFTTMLDILTPTEDVFDRHWNWADLSQTQNITFENIF